ncbi:MAG: hypothetical protein WBE26_05090 [Phycisphaerae bacterium]
MRKKTLKGAALAAMAGTMLQFGGCLGDSWWGRILWDGVIYAGYEYVLDNDGVFDLFEDGDVVVTQD